MENVPSYKELLNLEPNHSSAQIDTAVDMKSNSINSNHQMASQVLIAETNINDSDEIIRQISLMRYGELIELAENENEENLEEIKKFHEKNMKIFKQTRMPMIGGGHSAAYTNAINNPGNIAQTNQ